MSFFLYLQVYIVRFIQGLSARGDLKSPQPIPRPPTFTKSIPSISRLKAGNINLLFYTPPNYTSNPKEPYALIINFHGGGYTVGAARDSARLAHAVTSSLPAVFVSVEYGLAPEHPYPTAIGDCVDTVRWLWEHGAEYGLDVRKTILTGQSAGGTLSVVTCLRVNGQGNGNHVLSANERKGRIVGLVPLYPGLDWRQTRAQRTASNPISETKGSIPKPVYSMFDRSYLGPQGMTGQDMASLDFSPAAAGDDVLREGLPERVALYSCEYDQLLVEDEAFRERLKGLGKEVAGYTVMGEPHGFDLMKIKGEAHEKRMRMYEDAASAMGGMIDLK